MCACVISYSMPIHGSGVARMSKLRGHSMGTFSARVLLGELGHASAIKILHSEIASEVVFGYRYHFFSLTCMLTSCPHKSDRTC